MGLIMLKIVTIPVTLFEQNCRILFDTDSNVGVVIDPGGDVDKIAEAIESIGCTVKEIWLTHSHLDHCAGVAGLVHRYSAELLATSCEKSMRASVCSIAAMYGLSAEEWPNCPEPSRYIDHGDVLTVGNYSAHVLSTPGHSPGHVSFYFKSEGFVIGGDALFRGSIGRTDLPGGDMSQLLASIERELLSLPEGTRVLTGHGPDTTIEQEKKNNPFLS